MTCQTFTFISFIVVSHATYIFHFGSLQYLQLFSSVPEHVFNRDEISFWYRCHILMESFTNDFDEIELIFLNAWQRRVRSWAIHSSKGMGWMETVQEKVVLPAVLSGLLVETIYREPTLPFEGQSFWSYSWSYTFFAENKSDRRADQRINMKLVLWTA